MKKRKKGDKKQGDERAWLNHSSHGEKFDTIAERIKTHSASLFFISGNAG